MSREAVVSLLSGLRDVSLRNIPAASTTAVGQQMPKLFALNRMVEVLLYNIGRIYDLWAIFLRCGWLLPAAGLFFLLAPPAGCWAIFSRQPGNRLSSVLHASSASVSNHAPVCFACFACPPTPPAATCWK